MEEIERQHEREADVRARSDELEEQGERMDERTDRLGEKIEDTREDFERKQASEDVPGAQEEGAHAPGHQPPPEAEITPGD